MLAALPPATRALLFANIAVFLLQCLLWDLMMQLFALWPIGAGFRPWQLVTYAFLHEHLPHLFFNMVGLFLFGGRLEQYCGTRYFLSYYTACVLTAAATQIAVQYLTGNSYHTVGASGGVFGVLLAYATFFPRHRTFLLPAWLLASLFGVAELILGVTGTQEEGVAHFAHLGGMLGGVLMLAYWWTIGRLRIRDRGRG
jgi:membrane associated rhomboid family serine protease